MAYCAGTGPSLPGPGLEEGRWINDSRCGAGLPEIRSEQPNADAKKWQMVCELTSSPNSKSAVPNWQRCLQPLDVSVVDVSDS